MMCLCRIVAIFQSLVIYFIIYPLPANFPIDEVMMRTYGIGIIACVKAISYDSGFLNVSRHIGNTRFIISLDTFKTLLAVRYQYVSLHLIAYF